MPASHSNEIWKPVVGYEGIYSVSDLGRIRRDLKRQSTTAGRMLKQAISGRGYAQVTLSNDWRATLRVHRLVAEAFLGVRPKEKETNHKNGDKTDNRAENLEYITPRENKIHAIALGKYPSRKGERNTMSKLSDDDVFKIRILARKKERTVRSIAREFGVHEGTIHAVIHGRSWTHI